MIREFLFKVLVEMYNQNFFLTKVKKNAQKFFVNNKLIFKIIKSKN